MMVVDSEIDARNASDENALLPEQAEHEIEPPIQFSGVTVFNGVALGQAQILAEGELEWLAAIPGGIELLAVGKSSDVVDRNLLSPSWLLAGTFTADDLGDLSVSGNVDWSA